MKWRHNTLVLLAIIVLAFVAAGALALATGLLSGCAGVRRVPASSPDCKWHCHAPADACCSELNSSCCDW